MATIEQQVKDLKKEKDYCCTQIMYQLAGLDALDLEDPVAQKALRGLGWGARTQLTCGAITGGAMVLALYIDDKEQMIKAIQKQGEFTPPHDFEDLRRAADKYISQGVSMGEGWMITAEMAVLAETGTENIICTQPFGCLPNHIVAKGMARTIKNAYPNANIVAIDYDPGATRVNQENRIKLMLANAKMEQENQV